MDHSLPARPIRPVTTDEVQTFWRDGVVCLRQILPQAWVDAMVSPVEEALRGPSTADLTQMGNDLEARTGARRTVDDAGGATTSGRGNFLAGTDHWCEIPQFAELALHSPLGPIVATLLRSDHVRLYEDSLLVKEPGTEERTVFHQDMAYFHLAGDQVCTTWVPLDPVTAESGAVRFVIGSHLDRTRYRPNLFVTTMAIPGTSGADVPDYDADGTGLAQIVSFDTEPGDITVHHARTIHGAHANASATRRRRAISVRYIGDDATFSPVAGAPGKAHHASLRPGEPLSEDACPLAWPR